MSRSFMILFMVSVDTRLNGNSFLILIFFLYCFYAWVKSIFRPLLKIEATSFCLDNNLSFSSYIIFSCILLFLFEKYSSHAFQNGLELQPTLSFSKYCNLAFFIQIYHEVSLSLKLDNINKIF